MPRWARICQQCWEVCNNDQYWPDEPRRGYEQGCDACGDEYALSVNVHPDIVAETKAIIDAERVQPDCTGLPEPKEAHA